MLANIGSEKLQVAYCVSIVLKWPKIMQMIRYAKHTFIAIWQVCVGIFLEHTNLFTMTKYCLIYLTLNIQKIF